MEENKKAPYLGQFQTNRKNVCNTLDKKSHPLRREAIFIFFKEFADIFSACARQTNRLFDEMALIYVKVQLCFSVFVGFVANMGHERQRA